MTLSRSEGVVNLLCTAPNKMTKHFEVININVHIVPDATPLPILFFVIRWLDIGELQLPFLVLQSWPLHPSQTSSRAPSDLSALTRCWSTTLAYVLYSLQIKWICDKQSNIAIKVTVFCAFHGVMAGRDHYQRWSHHPKATGGGAPGCQGSLWVGRSSRQGGRRWDHFCGK